MVPEPLNPKALTNDITEAVTNTCKKLLLDMDLWMFILSDVLFPIGIREIVIFESFTSASFPELSISEQL